MSVRVPLLPPWGPDLTPIEKMFSKVKGVLRTLAARTTGNLVEVMGMAWRRVCSKDALGWFQSCGLAVDPARKQMQSLLHQLKTGNREQPAWEAY